MNLQTPEIINSLFEFGLQILGINLNTSTWRSKQVKKNFPESSMFRFIFTESAQIK